MGNTEHVNQPHLSQADRSEMLRAHAGLVTTLVAGDERARREQLNAIVQEHAEQSNGDVGTFAGRMGKQVEGGALITHTILRMLAKRLELSDEETQVVIAQAIARVGDDMFPE